MHQPGSSMHRIVKLANGQVKYALWKSDLGQTFLTDEDALEIAAFVNDDAIHKRPYVKNFDFPYSEEKAIDYFNRSV